MWKFDSPRFLHPRVPTILGCESHSQAGLATLSPNSKSHLRNLTAKLARLEQSALPFSDTVPFKDVICHIGGVSVELRADCSQEGIHLGSWGDFLLFVNVSVITYVAGLNYITAPDDCRLLLPFLLLWSHLGPCEGGGGLWGRKQASAQVRIL